MKKKKKTAVKKKVSFDVQLKDTFVEIIRKTSAEMPKDVIEALKDARAKEQQMSRADYALKLMEKNIDLAKAKSAPLCQDTGTLLFYIHYPKMLDLKKFTKIIEKAITEATKKGYLRQNTVDSLTGKNIPDNIGPGAPVFHFEPWEKNFFDIRLMLKGGGCENVGAQYSLPDSRIGAGRDLDGVRKCIIDAVIQAQGKGCGPGILGVTVGGDRASGYAASKELFLDVIGTRSKNPVLAQLEVQALAEANQSGIGPMGFGGKTTLLDVKINALHRLPASFFVSISYMCWSYRRQGAIVDSKAQIKRWIYK